MGTDLQRRFHAAVDLIKSLPRDGPFKPSHDIQLKLYALYKQAIVGPCKEAKPSFWDVVKKAKWDAWTKLGDMASAEAMNTYIQELLKIVETMPQSDEVISFRALIGSEASAHEDVVARQHGAGGKEDSGNLAERPGLQTGVPITSETTDTAINTVDHKLTLDNRVSSEVAGRAIPTAFMEVDNAGVQAGSDSESEAFCDTSEVLDQHFSHAQVDTADRVDAAVEQQVSHTELGANSDAESTRIVEGSSGHAPASLTTSAHVEHTLCAAARAQASETLARLQADVACVFRRLEAVEAQLRASQADRRGNQQQPASSLLSARAQRKPSWHPRYLLRSTTAQTLALMVWPFFVFWALNSFSLRRKSSLR